MRQPCNLPLYYVHIFNNCLLLVRGRFLLVHIVGSRELTSHSRHFELLNFCSTPVLAKPDTKTVCASTGTALEWTGRGVKLPSLALSFELVELAAHGLLALASQAVHRLLVLALQPRRATLPARETGRKKE